MVRSCQLQGVSLVEVVAMLARISRSVLAALCVSSVVGCGGSKAMEIESWQTEKKCTPGTVYSCVRWNCSGHQVCQDDGTTFSACACDMADGGDVDGILIAGGGSGGSGIQRASSRGMNSSSSGRGSAWIAQPDAGKKPEDAGRSSSDPQDAGQPRMPAREDAGKPGMAMTMTNPPDMTMTMMMTMPSMPEQCDNGLDDDADGKTDCADPDCTALRCVDAAPSGWTGPIAMSSSAATNCSGLFDRPAFTAGAEPQAAPAQCSACTCQGSCSTFVDFSVSPGNMCGAATACTTSVNGACVEITPQCLQMATVASLETRLPNAGTCTSTEQKATIAAPSWKTQVAACGLRAAGTAAAGCDAAQLCLPAAPGAGLAADYCIWREGEADCPATTYTERSVYYRELQDTRACTACSCAAASCKYSWKIFGADDTTCATPVLELTSTGQCAQVNPVMGKLRVGSTVSGDASCTAAGGETRGAVAGAMPLTVCCSR